MNYRRVLKLNGVDTRNFLQGLITNDVTKLDLGPIYAAILTPQGKFMADFFLMAQGDSVLLDVADDRADGLVQRLNMYKLRADVSIVASALHLHRGVGAVPTDGYADPRNTHMGWRAYRDTPQSGDTTDWDALRVAHMIPETGLELTPNSFILEMGFERLNGVDFRKGCYVGQEIIARMQHKTELRKGLAKILISAPVDAGTEISADGKAVGTVFTQSGSYALAFLRYDRAKATMQAGGANVTMVIDD